MPVHQSKPEPTTAPPKEGDRDEEKERLQKKLADREKKKKFKK